MTSKPFNRWLAALGAAGLLALPAVQAHADAGGLRSKYQDLRQELQHNSYQRQMYIDSTESANALQGDVYAVLDHPFEKVKGSLQDPNAWCDIMLLPFNQRKPAGSAHRPQVRPAGRPGLQDRLPVPERGGEQRLPGVAVDRAGGPGGHA